MTASGENPPPREERPALDLRTIFLYPSLIASARRAALARSMPRRGSGTDERGKAAA
jgi:hypothetical protein